MYDRIQQHNRSRVTRTTRPCPIRHSIIVQKHHIGFGGGVLRRFLIQYCTFHAIQRRQKLNETGTHAVHQHLSKHKSSSKNYGSKQKVQIAKMRLQMMQNVKNFPSSFFF